MGSLRRLSASMALGIAASGSLPADSQSGTALSRFLAAQSTALVFISSTQSCDNGLSGGPFEGSGFVITRSGFVLTAAHVIDGVGRGGNSQRPAVCPGSRYRYLGMLGSSEGEPRELSLVALDDQRDLALLKFVSADDYKAFELASSDGMQTTDEILAMGFPVGSESDVPARGTITDQARADYRWLINAPVSHGHSGGPVVRRDGKVVGVVDAGIQSGALMSLIVPLRRNDPLLAPSGVSQDLHGLNATEGHAVPDRVDFNDIPRDGSCEDRRPQFEHLASGVRWSCQEVDVDRGVKPNVHITKLIRVNVPASAAILDVRYFHRSRGDYRNPEPMGPWNANPPDADLQWMRVDKATVATSGTGDRDISALCDNWSAELHMYCALGVQYQTDANLW